MSLARNPACIVAGLFFLVAAGCDSGDFAKEIQALQAQKPLGPFEGTEGEFTTTDSGLQYRIVREGNEVKPEPQDVVKAHYEGKLVNGYEFDSSYKRQEPTEFPLQGVIAGWTEGLQLIGIGGQIDLIIPSKLGYKERGTPSGEIPPGATLYFTVELLDIMRMPDAQETHEEHAAFDPDKPLGPFSEEEGEFTTTDSGLKYRITKEGTGRKPAPTESVTVYYEGKFADGDLFDKSSGGPTSFPLNKVVAGWTEGLQLVGEGGKIDLILPPDLAYGPEGQGSIPPNATLYFSVELLKIGK